MNKLLRAGFARMWKSKVFYVINCLFAALGAGFQLLALVTQKKTGSKVPLPLDSGFFMSAAFIGIAMAVFCSLFLGTEYSDGTIRNKLISGHSRGAVYLSNLLLCISAGILFTLSGYAASLLVGIPRSGFFHGSPASVLVPMGLYAVLVAAYSSVFVFFAMINQNKAMVSVLTLVLSFVLFLTSTVIYSRLNEPETYTDYEYTSEGDLKKKNPRPNPNYLRGTKKKVYEFLFDFLPGCQGTRIADMYKPAPKGIFSVYSLSIVVVMTGAGLFVFRRKNIK